MDAKEAVRIIRKMYKAQPINERLSIDNAALSTAISALEKVPVLEAENARLEERETPKVVINTGYWEVSMGGRLVAACPSCGAKIGAFDKFCFNCGQAINNDKE